MTTVVGYIRTSIDRQDLNPEAQRRERGNRLGRYRYTVERSLRHALRAPGNRADASGWDEVISRLREQGYPVIAPANLLKGPKGDSVYIGSVLRNVKGISS